MSPTRARLAGGSPAEKPDLIDYPVVKKEKEKRHAAPITKGVAIYSQDQRAIEDRNDPFINFTIFNKNQATGSHSSFNITFK